MRNHRRALIVISFVAIIAAMTPFMAGTAAPAHKEHAAWTLLPETQLTSMRTQLITKASLAPLLVYFGQVQAATTTTTSPPSPSTTLPARAPSSPSTVSPPTTSPPAITTGTPATYTGSDTYAEWSKVASCEEGGWIGSSGSAYPNSLGIIASAWYAHGGGSEDPASQIAVATSLINSLVGTVIQGHVVYVGFVPDNDGLGCRAW